MADAKEYILIDSKKLAEIKYKALQKKAANLERPLSEESIEAKAVIDVINYIYEYNEWLDSTEPKSKESLAYEQGWKDGYHEGLYDKENK
jgi:hypothetical protein